MSREIKFRIWDKHYKRFIDKGFIDSSCGLSGYIDSEGFETCKEYELSQYTGIKDKHGTEIYEGDIVRKDGGEIVEVVFFCGTFTPKLKEGQCAIITYDGTSVWQNGEVIGNIYENPELLR